MLSFKSVVILAALLYSSNCDDSLLPSYITPCDLEKSNYAGCVKEQIEIALPLFTKGIPEMGVPSTDPVQLDDINLDGSALKLTFTQAQMHGLAGAKLSQLKVVIGKSDEAFTLAFKADMKLTAQYEVDGKILILPIQGKGDARVKAKNVEVTIESKLTHVKGDKGEFFKLSTPSYKYDIEKTTFEFDNLFMGNKQLAETTIQFANQNWRQLMDDLAPPAIKQIVKTIVRAINKFFSKVPINKIFKNYESFSSKRT